MERYICIHGHFYQPPRENPWLEAIEQQDSAYPYHDWNERITAECYAPNAHSRILDDANRIEKMANNYAKISFDFGPTLLSWLEAHAPDVYGAILEADRESQKNFSGHGSALAQVYNHMIMPLANSRDKYTQVLWGIRDFEHRFGRKPEGMWLPETAVDLESLRIMADLGIRFTILAPHQAKRVRTMGSRAWRDVGGASIDPTMAYELRLSSGRKIALFFYDAIISRGVAFEGLLTRGEDFSHRLLAGFPAQREWPQLVHIATDGESYGHHHRFGDMALVYALNFIESNHLARLTNYGAYLERSPPTCQVEIFENSSWSCAHGIERWRSDCGCNSRSHPEWNQAWRAQLRSSLDWLRDTVATRYYEEMGRDFLQDPWAARNDYIGFVLDRSEKNLQRFLEWHAVRPLSEPERVAVLKLLELQRYAMLMYTSCAWFFDDLSGIETVQILQYAGRAVQLSQELFGDALESQFIERLGAAQSNIPDHGNGRRIYEKFVKSARADWKRVGAHYAISSLFKAYPERATVYCYEVDREDYRSFETGRARLVAGRARLTSKITRESSVLSFGVLHFGDHNLNGGVQESLAEDAYRGFIHEAADPFSRGDFPEVIRIMDRRFGESNYSIRSLFQDEQRKILGLILASSLTASETLCRQIYERNAALMRLLTDLHIPLPKAFYAAAEIVLNANLRKALEGEELDIERIGALLAAAKAEGVALDTATLEFAYRRNIERMAEEFAARSTDLALLQRLEAAAGLRERLPFPVDVWKAQNLYYAVLQKIYPHHRSRAERGDRESQIWTGRFLALGEKLSIRVRESSPSS